MVFLLQRLYAWGTICAMYNRGYPEAKDGGAREGRGAEKKASPSAYVQWVLSKGQRVRGVLPTPGGQGGGGGEERGQDLDDLVDRMTGAKRTEDEEAQDFFGSLYEMSSWKQLPAVPRPNDLLR